MHKTIIISITKIQKKMNLQNVEVISDKVPALLHFVWPKNFYMTKELYMTHQLLYDQSNFYMTNEILISLFFIRLN